MKLSSTNELKEKLREAFESFDKSNKGTLNGEEIEKFMDFLTTKTGFYPSEVKKIYAELTHNSRYTLEDVENSLSASSDKKRSRLSSPTDKSRGMDSVGLSTDEQMIPAARIIFILQQIKTKFELDTTLINEINWCIEQIGIGSIYEPVSSRGIISSVPAAQRSQALPWIAQFSTPELDMDKIQDMLKKNAQDLGPLTPDEARKEASNRAKRRSIVAQNLAAEVQKVQELLETVNSPNFSIIEVEHKLGREKVLPFIAYKIFEDNQLFTKTAIDESAFVAFVSEIRKGYMNNPYHNDIHAADVTQMCHYLLNQGGIKEILKLSDLDVAALLLSAIVHDFRHPGVTNGFLINSNNDLAIAYNDKSVLESYHISEAYKLILKNEKCNLFKDLTLNERILMRKRMIGCVTATDMAFHGAMMQRVKNLIIVNGIKKGRNIMS